MLDDIDEGARVGVWVTIGIISLLLFGLIGALVLRQMHGRAEVAVAAPAPSPSGVTLPAVGHAQAFVDRELAGERLTAVYFAVGESELDTPDRSALEGVLTALGAGAQRQVLLSGFHDASGDPAKNAELAKARALAVREELVMRGIAAERLLLRKPASTLGEGAPEEARRVEVWLLN